MTDNKQKRILVVEDIDSLRQQHVMTLELEGFSVDSAANLQEALDLIEAKTFHVALIDLMLTDTKDSTYEGLEILKKLQELGEGTRSIVISGQDDPGTAADTITEYGAVKYIKKSKIRDEGTAYLIKEVTQLAEVVTMKQYSEMSYIFSIMAGTGKDAANIWSHPFLTEFKPKEGATGFNKFLQKFCEPIVPLMPQSNVSPPLPLNKEKRYANGKFWSKGLGLPVELVICRADEATKILESGNNPTWQSSPLIERENHGLKGYVFPLPESVTRSEFIPTL